MKLLTVVLALTRSGSCAGAGQPQEGHHDHLYIEDVVDRHRSHDVQAVILIAAVTLSVPERTAIVSAAACP